MKIGYARIRRRSVLARKVMARVLSQALVARRHAMITARPTMAMAIVEAIKDAEADMEEPPTGLDSMLLALITLTVTIPGDSVSTTLMGLISALVRTLDADEEAEDIMEAVVVEEAVEVMPAKATPAIMTPITYLRVPHHPKAIRTPEGPMGLLQ